MTRPKNPQPTQFSLRLKRPHCRPINRIIRNRRTTKLICLREIDCIDRVQCTEPVADEIRIAGPDQGLDAGLHDAGEGWEEIARIWVLVNI